MDAYVEVAQRPPEPPLFGRRILEWVLSSHSGEPVIQFGDLLDMSCESELRRMGAVFSGARLPVSILPGNHDGLMFGTFNYALFGDLTESSGHAWYRGCIRGAAEDPNGGRRNARDYAVDKRRFIEAYLSRLSAAIGEDSGLAAPARDGEARVSWRNRAQDPFLAAVEARLRGGSAYDELVVAQNLRLPAAPGARRRVTVIGLDTNQVDVFDGMLDTLRRVSPGDIGHVRR